LDGGLQDLPKSANQGSLAVNRGKLRSTYGFHLFAALLKLLFFPQTDDESFDEFQNLQNF